MLNRQDIEIAQGDFNVGPVPTHMGEERVSQTSRMGAGDAGAAVDTKEVERFHREEDTSMTSDWIGLVRHDTVAPDARMHTDHLEIFATVFRAGSLAAAARVHRLDPSRVSRVIQMLETELGAPLFERSTRRLVPTEAGRLYHAEISPLLEGLKTAHQRIAELTDGEPTGELRVSAPVSFGLLNLVPWLPHFQARYPRVTVDLRLHDGPPALGPHGVEVALALGPLEDADWVASPLATLQPRLCASPAYIERHGRPRRPEDIARHAVLVLQMPGFDDVWRFRRGTAGAWREVRGRVVLRTSNALALKECALAGQGLIVQAEWIVGRELQEGRLVDLLPEWTVRTANFPNPAMWLLHPRAGYLPSKARAFIAFLREQFADGCPYSKPVKI